MPARARKRDPDPRPLWFLAPGGRPTLCTARRLPRRAVWQCREGDERWTLIAGADETPATENEEQDPR